MVTTRLLLLMMRWTIMCRLAKLSWRSFLNHLSWIFQCDHSITLPHLWTPNRPLVSKWPQSCFVLKCLEFLQMSWNVLETEVFSWKCPEMSLFLPFRCPENSLKMSWKVLKCPEFSFVKLCSHHGQKCDHSIRIPNFKMSTGPGV